VGVEVLFLAQRVAAAMAARPISILPQEVRSALARRIAAPVAATSLSHLDPRLTNRAAKYLSQVVHQEAQAVAARLLLLGPVNSVVAVNCRFLAEQQNPCRRSAEV
jgi:flagellar motor switch protein FliG